MYFVSILVALALIGEGQARLPVTKKKTNWGQIAADACARELESYNYNTEVKGRHAILCTYQPALDSWLLCTKAVLEAKDRKSTELNSGFQKINELCSAYYEDQVPTKEEYFKMIENSESTVIPLSGAESPLTRPVTPDETSLEEWVWAIYGPLDNLDKGNVYGTVICTFWLGVLVIAIMYRALLASRIDKFRWLVLKNKYAALLRGRLVLPALWYSHAREVGRYCFISLIPTRLESLTLAMYCVLHAVFLFKVNIDHRQLLSNYKNQIIIFLSDRAGILAFAHFPLIILFAGRNQVIQSLTGIKYSTFIVFHKWLGRVMLADAILHALGYTYHSYLSHYWMHVKHNPVWHHGRVAMVTASLITFFSFFFFRFYCYEIFLIGHIILAVIFFYACLKHCMNLGWTEWIIISIIFWCADRLVRIMRIAFFGFPEARLELYGASLIKIRIPKKTKYWRAQPGQYIYLQFMKPTLFWQSHPFCVMDSLVEKNELTVVMTVKEGITKKLRNSIATENSSKLRVAVEGPYGHTICTKAFKGILFLAAGAGVPGPLSMALKAAKVEDGKEKLITFVWTVRDTSLLQIFEKEIRLLEDSSIDVQLYFTGKRNRGSIQEDEGLPSKSSKEETVRLKGEAEFPIKQYTRPNVDYLLESALCSSDSLLVVACGSAAFVDQGREIVARKVLKYHEKCIEYAEDFQNW